MVSGHDFGNDGQPEAATTSIAGSGGIEADEPFKHPLALVGWDARAVVGDAYDGGVSHSLTNEFDSAVGMPGRVVNQITHHARELSAVAADPDGADPRLHRQSRVPLEANLFRRR